MHTPDIPQRITRSAQRVGDSVRRKLAGRHEHGHCTLLFIFQTTVPQVSRHADDFEIALLVRERDAPADPRRLYLSPLLSYQSGSVSCGQTWPEPTRTAKIKSALECSV